MSISCAQQRFEPNEPGMDHAAPPASSEVEVKSELSPSSSNQPTDSDANAGRAAHRSRMFGQRIRTRRKELGLTLVGLAEKIRCQKGYLSMIETGQRPPPQPALLNRLESVLRFEVGDLIALAHWETAPVEVMQQVKSLQSTNRQACDLAEQLLDNPRSLDDMLRTGQLRKLVEENTANVEQAMPCTRRVPVMNNVAAGYPQFFTDLDYPAEHADHYEHCSEESWDGQLFAATIVGNSMEPMYHEGDTVTFSPHAATADGSDCFVRIEPDHETTFKRIYFEGRDQSRIRLHALNPKYEDRVLSREQIAGLYTAVSVTRRVDRLPAHLK